MTPHYAIMGNYIVSDNGHGGWTKIAEIIVLRPCKHLIRHSQAAEEVESCIDRLIGETLGVNEAKCFEVK